MLHGLIDLFKVVITLLLSVVLKLQSSPEVETNSFRAYTSVFSNENKCIRKILLKILKIIL